MGGNSSAQPRPGMPPRPNSVDSNDLMVHSVQLQMEAMADLYTRMMDQCYKKCISSYNEQELTKGEAACVERCVVKYTEMQAKMNIRLNSIGQQQIAPGNVQQQ